MSQGLDDGNAQLGGGCVGTAEAHAKDVSAKAAQQLEQERLAAASVARRLEEQLSDAQQQLQAGATSAAAAIQASEERATQAAASFQRLIVQIEAEKQKCAKASERQQVAEQRLEGVQAAKEVSAKALIALQNTLAMLETAAGRRIAGTSQGACKLSSIPPLACLANQCLCNESLGVDESSPDIH